MYESPIQMISEDIIKDIVEKQNGYLIEIVHRLGFDVNEEEIKRALAYDRNQWERGYADGKMDGYHLRDTEIVRCKDCKWYDLTDPCGTLTPTAHRCKRVTRLWMEDDAYCSYGERRDDDTLH